MIRSLLLVYGLLCALGTFSQKIAIDHTAYNRWNKIERQVISNDGNWIAYETTPLKGDGFVCIFNVLTNKTDTIQRGKAPMFNGHSTLLLVKITPGYDTLRNCEFNKVEKTKWPKDSLYILDLSTQKSLKVAKLKQYKLSNDGGRVAYLTEAAKISPAKKKWYCPFQKKEQPAPKSNGGLLVVLNNSLEKEFEKKQVTEFEFTSKGEWLSFITHQKVKSDSFSLQFYDFNAKNSHQLKNETAYKLPAWSPDLSKVAFLSSSDSSKIKQYTLHYMSTSDWVDWVIGDSLTKEIDTTKGISENREPLFSKQGNYLFFGVADRVKGVKDTLLDSEKVHLDIWHYQDDRIQPQQLVQLKEDLKKNDLYVLDIEHKKILRISNDTLRVYVDKNQMGDFLLATSNQSYAIQSQWSAPALEDVYRIHLPSGEIRLIKAALGFGGALSPKGRFYSYFDANSKNHFLVDMEKNTESCVTCEVKNVTWHEDVNGQPMLEGPIRDLQYVAGEDNFIVSSEFDIWNYSLETKKLTCLTENEGALNGIRLSLTKWESDSVYVDLNDCYIRGLNTITKASHIFSFQNHNGHVDFREVYHTDHSITSLLKSKNNKQIMLRKMSISQYPEISLMDSSFSDEKIISNTNPQQKDYNWARVELIKWKGYDGTSLEGLVYKPEDFDSTKRYPLIIYYYELNADNLHNHNAPRPSSSTINPVEYASAGYLVFIPDIRTKAGYPAKSAYNCIMSGTDHLIKNFPVDSLKMGLQGQSWGGYQTAQLITMTPRYAAAMAGAPVGNMFSAYGGIRWGSGLNRQFQYESTQSRIGKTIWEAQDAYIENSPLFHLPNVSTPLLLMHNDMDGSVPWYQSIEIYNGMRRLNKPCWLLNYNNDDHNLTKMPNKMDLSIRMRQFFDHFLLNKPAPSWITDGLPATKKGIITGY
ncbi:MAG: prolyl oligopeptidase family serine peptidase [Crocinitomicaceae bacterium]|nr:prolyl oligopeptidase family serine peptidase [Crocinitomicaceae bacterium]